MEILGLENKKTETKSSVNGPNVRIEGTKERIRKLEDRVIETTQSG